MAHTGHKAVGECNEGFGRVNEERLRKLTVCSLDYVRKGHNRCYLHNPSAAREILGEE